MNAKLNKVLQPNIPANYDPDPSIVSTTSLPLWKYTDEELQDFQVTPFSKYRDQLWQREVKTPGVNKCTCAINWGMKLHDGSRLSDAQHGIRLLWSKKLMAVLLHAPSDGMGPAEGSMGAIQQSFKWLLSWMAANGYQQVNEVTEEVFNYYIEDLPRYIAEQQDDADEIGEDVVARCLNVLAYAWSERRVLATLGVPSLSHNLLYEKGVSGYAKDIATKARGWIRPLPDEVAVPLFNKAAWFLGTPAEDVIRLVEDLHDTSGKGFSVKKNQEITAGNIASFGFSVLEGETDPWHMSLDSEYEHAFKIHPQLRLRQLVEAVRDACAITVQGTSGMRVSELMGIDAGMDEATGLPKGVRIEDSATGLYQLFLIKTVLSKTEKGLPREVDWVLGLRPKGTTQEPLAVRALRLLNRLYQPWRDSAKSGRLFLAFNGHFLPVPSSKLNAMGSTSVRLGMKRFMERWVDLSALPNESAHKTADNDLVKWRDSLGTIIATHMLRKSWAHFTLAVNSKLMAAIQLQFHHMSIAMTESGYIGNNPLLVSAMDSIATQQRNLLIFETVLGREPLAGKMGEQVEKATRDLAAQLKDLPTSDAWQATIKFCDDNDLKIFFNPHGKCVPVATSKMRCHNEAGTPLGLRLQPNSATRQPSLCAGCDCFVLDRKHAPFWEERYLQNWISYKRSERMGISGDFRVIKERAVQAGKLLKKIGIKVELLNQTIELALKEEDV